MSERGVFAVDRGIWEHDFFADEPFTQREAWVWMIGEAAYKARRVRVGSARVELKRGQFSHSLRHLASKWKWSEPTVRRFLAKLREEGMIDATAVAGVTQITICKYDEYQRVSLPDDASTDADETQDRRSSDAKEKEKYKEDKEKEDADACAREVAEKSAFSQQANQLADDVLRLQRLDRDDLRAVATHHTCRAWLFKGWDADVIRSAIEIVMSRREEAPQALRYFEGAIAAAHAERDRPLPVAILNARPEPTYGRRTEKPQDASDVIRRLDEEYGALAGR